jgi:hypothetical protein
MSLSSRNSLCVGYLIAFVSDRTSGAILMYALQQFPAATEIFAEHDCPPMDSATRRCE